jgi:hypothetical protein
MVTIGCLTLTKLKNNLNLKNKTMNTAIILLLVIGGLLALFFIVALVANKEMNIERSITINKPPRQVFDYIRQVKNHDNFSVWNMMDPDMKKEYRGTDGQEGFVYAWDSSKKKNVGAGEQEIKKISDGKSIEFELRFTRPMQDVAQAKMTTEDANGGTKVYWGFYSRMKFPMNAMKPLFQNMLDKSLQQGLTNLKNVIEK